LLINIRLGSTPRVRPSVAAMTAIGASRPFLCVPAKVR
jgi:hypothetical protein